MFLDSFIEFISSDASLNSLCTGGIRYDHLPTNFNADLDWLVFGVGINSVIATIGNKNAITDYNVEMQVISKKAANVENISNRLNDFITTYPNEYNIDAHLNNKPQDDFNPERGVYYKTLIYNILY